MSRSRAASRRASLRSSASATVEGRFAVLGPRHRLDADRRLPRADPLHREERLDFSRVVTFNLDEYFPMTAESLHSYPPVHVGEPVRARERGSARVHLPRGDLAGTRVEAHCDAYEDAIRAPAASTLQILGIGQTGHIGFNEPGSSVASRTRLVVLDTITRRAAAADFFGTENVPTEAVTMGVGTILEAREIALIATGEHKAAIVKRAVEGDVDHAVAATYSSAPERHGVPGRAAAARADAREDAVAPGEIEWTPSSETQAVVWLSGATGKSVLEARRRGLSRAPPERAAPAPRLVGASERRGLQHAHRARSAAEQAAERQARHRVLAASRRRRHLGGGILRKLHQNGNAIVVAYQTSGNIAVFDHEVSRYLDFVRRAAHDFGSGTTGSNRGSSEIDAFLQQKSPARWTATRCSCSSGASARWRRSRRSRRSGSTRSRRGS
jgi:glucosamine-6-phosphate deaminase